MGRHEKYPKLIVYNGLGAKGYLLAPLLGKELADYLLHSIPLDKEIRYSRLQK
jgi:glycine/D-amino acid oxidase-like deaminating enzyme